ncbi:MAG TPA: tetratricopeptide repeat protein, partial [Candidatus Glassbacteria bacterium]|nr:tetratricopeptide repeat protein [Candidatus Glassbacteria bacterium]
MLKETQAFFKGSGAFLLVAAIVVLAGLPVLDNGFVNYKDNQTLLQPGREGRLALSYDNLAGSLAQTPENSFNPLRSLLFILLYNLGGESPRLFHLASLLLYVSICLLVYAVAGRLLAWDGFGTQARAGEVVSGNFWPLFAAALFAVSPLNAESLAWVSAVKHLLLAFFWLACLLSVMQYEESGNVRKLVAALICYILALTAGPAAAVLPLVVLVWYVLAPGNFRASAARRRVFAIALCVSAVYLYNQVPRWLEQLVFRPEGGPGVVAAEALKVFWSYVGGFFLPAGLSASYQVYPPHSLVDPVPLVLAAAFAAVLGACALAWRHGRRLPAFAAAWAVLAFLPTCGVVPLEVLRADRYTIVMLPALAIITAYLLREVEAGMNERYRTRVRAVIWVIPLLFGLQFAGRLRVWKDSESLWADVLRKNPGQAVALNGMANLRLAQGDTTAAVELLYRTLDADPHSVHALQSLGLFYRRSDENETAERFLQRAGAEPLERATSLLLLANLHIELSKPARAAEVLEKILGEQPGNISANLLLSTCYQKLGKLDEAVICLRRARAVDPDNLAYLTSLGRLLTLKGDLAEAVDLLGRALEADPDYVPTYIGLGELFLAAGKLVDSRASFTAALARDPDNLEALRGMAGVYGQAGMLDSASVLLDRLLAKNPRDCLALANLVALEFSSDNLTAAAGTLE